MEAANVSLMSYLFCYFNYVHRVVHASYQGSIASFCILFLQDIVCIFLVNFFSNRESFFPPVLSTSHTHTTYLVFFIQTPNGCVIIFAHFLGNTVNCNTAT